jgi:hypothetical protein
MASIIVLLPEVVGMLAIVPARELFSVAALHNDTKQRAPKNLNDILLAIQNLQRRNQRLNKDKTELLLKSGFLIQKKR